MKKNTEIIDVKCQGAVKFAILNMTVDESLKKKVTFEKPLQQRKKGEPFEN